jgi:hypothetical protein
MSDGSRADLSDDAWITWTIENLSTIADLAASGPETPIPACDGWRMEDLLTHVGRLYAGWYQYNLTRAPGEEDSAPAKQSAPPLPDSHTERISYLRDAARAWEDRVRASDLDRPVWGLVLAVKPARFWLRRAASESAIHRWDGEDALGRATTMSPERGAASVDETIDGLWPAMIRSSDNPKLVNLRALERVRTSPMRLPPLPSDPIGIRAVDAGRSWRVQIVDRDVDVRRDCVLPDTIVSGSGHELCLWFWNRIPVDRMDVIGDRGRAAALNISALAAP